MAVNLSPVGGVAAQFFDNSGNVLTGGKLYTYLAGTTTPQPAYTTAAGNVPWSNPIILDAAGRVSGSGEIWLTDGISYKFILRDSNDVLIATYDNINGINSNFVAFTNEQEIQTATAGQTVFNLTTMQYQPGTNSLTVFVDGVNQYGPGAQYAYIETDSDTVTFVNGLHVGALVKFTTSQLNSSGAGDAAQITYDPPFLNSAVTNVELKLAQTISVKDFGAAGDGVADDTTAFNNAIATGDPVYVPPGTYKTDNPVTSPRRLYTNGASFTGLTDIDPYPAFGQGTSKMFATANDNCFIAIAHNTNPASTFGFPTGVTGYGRYDNAGNTAFGIFGRSDSYAAGVATNELNSFNFAGAPTASLPPNRSIGTTEIVPVALTVAAGGTFASKFGIQISKEGSQPQQFETGIYIDPDTCSAYGIFVDCISTNPAIAVVAKHSTASLGINVIGVGTPVANNAWLQYQNGSGVVTFSIKQSGLLSFRSTITQATVGVAGAASVLPANPTGYLQVEINPGVVKVIPFYEP